MSHNYKDLNPDDAKSFIPSNEEILKRKETWEAFLEKYSNCDDNDDDGIDLNELSEEEGYGDEGEAIDQADDDSDVEDFVDNTDLQVESYCRGSEKFGDLSKDKQRERITVYLSPELVEQLKAVVIRRMTELEQMKLPFWEVSRERVQTKMSRDEHYFETPAFRFGSKSGQSLMDLQRTVASCRGNPKLNLNNVTINGIPAMQSNNFTLSSKSNDLPAAIQSLCKMDMNFSLKITEREYDVQVQGRNLPQVLKELNIPHPASFGCSEPFIISSDEEDSEQAGAQKTLMKSDGIQLKMEPKDMAVTIMKDPKPKDKSAQPSKVQTLNASSMSQKLAKLDFLPWISDDEQSRDIDCADKNPADEQSKVQKKPAVNKKKPTSKTGKNYEDESKNDQKKKLKEAKKAEKAEKKTEKKAEKASKKSPEQLHPKTQKKATKSKATEYYKFPGDSSNEDEDDSCNSNHKIAPKSDQPPQKRPRDLKK